jgi:Tol biopolymer transport system component
VASATTEIWVANANGSSPVRLGDGDKPAWAPSADSILFQKGNAVWIMAANGANARQLIANAAWPHWSPNGSRILFLREPGVTDIFPPAWWVANADGSGEVKVVELTMLENWGASWSPNGRKIVYYDAPAGEADLWTINLDGTGATNLTNSTEAQPERHESPSWFR